MANELLISLMTTFYSVLLTSERKCCK